MRGLCGLGGADKIAHPIHWLGEQIPYTGLVHGECEQQERARAYAALSVEQRESFLRSIK